MIIIIAEPGKKVHLGRIGENEARAVQFDISQTQAEFPGASFSVLNMRPQDPDAYPVNGQYIRIEGSNLYWTLQSGDLTEDGLGECELKATVDGVIVKSEIWTTEICPALDGNGTPPEPWESWQQQVEDDADRAEAAAELLEHPEAVAETLPAGSQATAGYADGVFTFGIPKGKDGLDGDTPTASVSKVGNTATITITDKDGTTTAQISDGTDGEDGFSPSASVTKSGKTATISITDKEGTTTAQITDGEDGEPGAVPIISIGTVTTLPAGSSASASMDTTDPEHPVLSMGIPKGDPGEVTEAELAAVETELKSQIDGKADLIHDTVQNVAIASVPDGANNLPLSALVIGIDPVQDLHGQANPYPAGGSPQRWDEEWEIYGNTQIRSKNRIHLTPGETYYAKTSPVGISLYFKETIDSAENVGSVIVTNNTFTVPANGNYAVLYSNVNYGSSYNHDISINYPSTDHDYHPWKNICLITGWTGANVYVAPTNSPDDPDKQTYPISWQTEAGTVYGGEADAVNGVMEKTMQIADIGDMSWNYNSTYGIMSVSLEQGKSITEESLLCSIYKFGGYNINNSEMASAPDKTIWKRFGNGLTQNATAIYIKDSDYTDKDAFKTAMQGQKIVYQLATPIEIHLSDVPQISTLKGVNNLWADCGNILLMEYGCDTKGYIDKKLAELTALILEN